MGTEQQTVGPDTSDIALVAERVARHAPCPVLIAVVIARFVGGSGFAAGQELEIEARIGNGGSAISRSGDPFGVARVKAGAKGRVSIEINQLKP